VARGLAPAVFPKEKAKPADIARLQTVVSQAAGRAGTATPLTGSWIMVQGIGRVDPIAAWFSMTQPHPALESGDVLNACDQMIGQLASMNLKARAEAPLTIGAEAMHPLVCGAAGRLWRDRHYRQPSVQLQSSDRPGQGPNGAQRRRRDGTLARGAVGQAGGGWQAATAMAR